MCAHCRTVYLFLITSVFLLGLGVSCAWMEKRQRVKTCRFRIQKVELSRYTLSSPRLVYLKIYLEVFNPNDEEALLDPFEWRLFANQWLLAKGRYPRQVQIPAKKNASFTLEIQLDLWQLSRTVVSLLLSGKATYQMEATIFLSTPLGSMKYEVKIREGKWSLWDSSTESPKGV